MLLGIALMLVGAAVLIAVRRALWPLRDEAPRDEPPRDDAPRETEAAGYDARPIYVPADRGTVYVSEVRDD